MNLEKQFNEAAAEYDNQRRKLIPRYDDFYGTAVNNLCLDTEEPAILDLGAGTGLFSQLVLDKYPNAKIDLVDLSEKMLAIAEKRFIDNPDVHIITVDYTSYTPKKKYDAVVSSLSIHHLTDRDKIKLYNSIYEWLNPGGLFINAEQILGPNEITEQIYRDQWEKEIEQTDLSADELASAYERVKLDIRTPLNQQLNWLSDAGFTTFDCLYKYYSFAVIWAKK